MNRINQSLNEQLDTYLSTIPEEKRANAKIHFYAGALVIAKTLAQNPSEADLKEIEEELNGFVQMIREELARRKSQN